MPAQEQTRLRSPNTLSMRPTAGQNLWSCNHLAGKQACFPAKWLHDYKFWPAVGRIDNVFGDRNLVCSCAGMEAYSDS